MFRELMVFTEITGSIESVLFRSRSIVMKLPSTKLLLYVRFNGELPSRQHLQI